MCLAQGPQRSDAGEARTRSPLVLSQALYHCTPLPFVIKIFVLSIFEWLFYTDLLYQSDIKTDSLVSGPVYFFC